MQADPDPVSDNRPDNDRGLDDKHGHVSFDRMVWARPAPDNIDSLPKTIPDHAEWWYDQNGKGKRGKYRRYTGQVTRINGTAGEKIRTELAAIIRDLLEWAKQQQGDAASEKESREDGGADDIAQ